MSKKNAKASTKKSSKAETNATTEKKMSALDAAAKVLVEAGEPMNTKQMIEAMATKGYWTSPGGKTPYATLYSAILREIAVKKTEARFQKTDRGHFASVTNAPAPKTEAATTDAKPAKKAKTKPAGKRGEKSE